MTHTTLSIESLQLVTGGQQAAPTPTRPEPTDAELEERMREKESLREWEKRHPFSAMWCQGDRECLRNGGAR
jgi:hypothetical protein